MKKQFLRIVSALCAAAALSVSAFAAPKMLIPGGCTVGIKLHTKGLVITQLAEPSAAKEAGLKKGDIIVEVDGEEVHTAQALKERIAEDDVVVTVLRNGREAEFCVTPKTGQLGAYVRDSIAGIGTVTYYDPITGDFGALGHGVNDAATACLIPVDDGAVLHSSVVEVEKGKSGTPGELRGKFDLSRILGTVRHNSVHGIFGTMTTPISAKPLPVASEEEVRLGKATILANVSGSSVKSYAVEVLKIYPNAQETGRNLLLKVTDRELLETTGGIVQGMSGSPIIQDGKLVGAVTHVLVNDPTKGYGIFIENMLDAAS